MPGHRAGQRGKRWCLTLNNYTEEERQKIKAFITPETCKFAIVGIEKSSTNTPHLQGFIHFLERKSLAQLKKNLNNRAHYELTRGMDAENDKYCSKEGLLLIRSGEPASGTTEKGGGFHKAEACVKAAHLMTDGLDIEDLAEDHMKEYKAVICHSIIEKHASCLRRRKAKAKGATKYAKQPL